MSKTKYDTETSIKVLQKFSLSLFEPLPTIVQKKELLQQVILLLDFDGTLTNTEGSKLVFTPLYMQLIESSYDQQSKLDVSKVVANMKLCAQWAPQEVAKFNVTEKAGAFLRHAFELKNKGYQVSINIISKNNADYIKANLIHSGYVSIEQLQKMSINARGDKFKCASEILANTAGNVKVIVCDDSFNDREQMRLAAKSKGFSDEQVKAYTSKPGQFDWTAIGIEMDDFLGVSVPMLADLEKAKQEVQQTNVSQDLLLPCFRVHTPIDQMEEAARFLNDVHAPHITVCDEGFKCNWRIEKGYLACVAPSNYTGMPGRQQPLGRDAGQTHLKLLA